MKPIRFALRSENLDTGLVVLGLRGTERIGATYAFEVVVRAKYGDFDEAKWLGVAATLTVEREGELPFSPVSLWRVSGIVDAVDVGAHEGGHALHRLRIVPRLALLALSEHSRIFTDVTVPEVIAAVLVDEGIPSDAFRIELDGDHPVRAHVCQYRESSLDFVTRLMEREGLFYFFEHHDDGEVLVIVDDASRYLDLGLGAVRYVPRSSSDGSAGESFARLDHERVALPGRVELTDDHDLDRSLELRAEAPVHDAWPEIVDHGAHLVDPEGATRYARIRAQALAARQERWIAEGGVIGLHCGGWVRFFPHESAPENALAVVSVEHAAVSTQIEPEARAMLGVDFEGGYRTRAELLSADLAYRLLPSVPWPRVAGVEPAVIDGPASSDYAQVDEHGRYKIRLLFDEGDLVDGSRSTWVRMLEPHGGAPDGFHFPLRKGTEVQVAFLGGDPDRPVIVGVAPNLDKPAVVRSSNNTLNMLRTGSGNVWELEDLAGAQRILLSTPALSSALHLGAGEQQLELRTNGCGLLHYGRDLDVSVGATKTEKVASDLRETYRQIHSLDVTGSSTRMLQTSWTQSVFGPVVSTIGSSFTERVSATVAEAYSTGLSTHVVGAASITDDGTLSLTVEGGLATERIAPSRTIVVGGSETLTVTGAVEETFDGTTRTVHGTYVERVSGTFTIKAPKMLVYASDATVVDQAISAVESTVSWVDSFLEEHYASGTSITGASLSATGLEVKATGLSSSQTGATAAKLAGVDLDLAGVRVAIRTTKLQTVGATMSVRGIHIIL